MEVCFLVFCSAYSCMFLILFLWISTVNSTTTESVYTVQEYCSGNSYIRYIEPGEPYLLTLRSENSSSNLSKSKLYQKSKRCRKEFRTGDPAAHFVVLMENLTMPSCSSNCRCNYFEIWAGERGKRYCGNKKELYFASKSNTLTIDFHPGISMPFDVTFLFNVERNSFVITGPASDRPYDSSSFIETPYFPSPYSPSYKAEYEMQSDDEDGYVLLLFLDFHVSHQSFIEVTGHNGSHPVRYYGNIFRPPVIISQSNHLFMKFESNNQAGMTGFRAICSFVKSRDNLVVPHTDCGGLKEERGGYISINPHPSFSLYDCIWQIIPSLLAISKSYVDVSIQLQNIGHKSRLEFRSGYHSKSEMVKVIDCEIQKCNELQAVTTVPATTDLYIRFKGYLDEHSVFNMTYGTYHTMNCSDLEYKCDDGRCLMPDFRCDGIKQCPNGEDEEMCTTTVIPELQTTASPSINAESLSSDFIVSKFLAIIIVGILGLIAAVAVILISVKKCKTVAASPQPTRIHPVIGEMTDVQPTVYPVNMYGQDNPPSYEDFVKAADSYPPPLYTRVRNILMPQNNCLQCTTSFSTASRMRHHSADSFNCRSSDGGSDIFSHTSDSSQMFNRCQPDGFKNNFAITPSIALKRSHSLDSKINDLIKQDSCHLFLSIIHPVSSTSNHLTHIQCHTLPTNFKISSCASPSSSTNGAAWLPANSCINFSRDRRFTWSFIPDPSESSEILTVLKSRCHSEPCKGIGVHCSLY